MVICAFRGLNPFISECFLLLSSFFIRILFIQKIPDLNKLLRLKYLNQLNVFMKNNEFFFSYIHSQHTDFFLAYRFFFIIKNNKKNWGCWLRVWFVYHIFYMNLWLNFFSFGDKLVTVLHCAFNSIFVFFVEYNNKKIHFFIVVLQECFIS